MKAKLLGLNEDTRCVELTRLCLWSRDQNYEPRLNLRLKMAALVLPINLNESEFQQLSAWPVWLMGLVHKLSFNLEALRICQSVFEATG